MTLEQRYNKVLRQTQTLQREVDRSQGAVDALKKEIRDELGCKNMAEAKARMDELEEVMETAQTDYEEALAKREEFHDKLREVE